MTINNQIKVIDSFLILCIVGLIAYSLTFLVTPGHFVVETLTNAQGESITKIDPDSFKLSDDGPEPLPLFAEGGELGLMNVPFEGLVAGSKWGTSIGVVAFILITGGAFGIILGTGTVNRALKRLIAGRSSAELSVVPILFVAFSLGGAVFGMGEEVIPFVLIVAPFFVAIGLDALTALLVTYVATQIGFATSWMNPFSVSIAQAIADVPILSGWQFRVTIWTLFTAAGACFTTWYAWKLKTGKLTSDCRPTYSNSTEVSSLESPLSVADKAILVVFIAGLVWIIWGVTSRHYYLPEIAAQFFSMSIAIAFIARIFSLPGFTADTAAHSFKEGAMNILPAALIVAFAKGIVLIIGGDDPESPSVINTILYVAASSLDGISALWSAQIMLFIQSVFNVFVTSGSGQAALTMPLMAPLSDLLGVSRQSAVLAFQLGDGLTNIIVPTSAALMGCLGAARVEWTVWIRFVAKPMIALYIFSMIALAVANLIGF